MTILTDPQWQQALWIAAALTATLLLLGWLTARLKDRPTQSLLRMDCYLPVLRKTASGQPSANRITAWIRGCMPSSWLSDRRTKKRGLVRRSLRRLGISWLAAPVRRLVQATCLLVFLALFLVVCWPYSASPRSTRPLVQSAVFVELDQESGDLIFELNSEEQTQLSNLPGFFLVRDAKDGGPIIREATWASELNPAADFQASLRPVDGMDGPLLDALLTAPESRWSIYEHDPQAWPSHYADDLARKEFLPAEFFLAIDPLVSLSTAIASRNWVWSLLAALMILGVCLLVPRGFCGYVCPLGSTIDLFDWAIGKRIKRFRVGGEGWWVHIKYYLLAGTLLCAVFGVLASGFVSAIPIITRAALMLLDPVQNGLVRGWHLVPGMNLGHVVSILLFAGVLCLGLLRPRFWCKYVCPSGALFSLGNLFRLTERKVESSCIHCNKCVEICPFDAIKPDFTTRVTDCTLCQSCAGVCPTHAIKFVERNNLVQLKATNEPPTQETQWGRRGFISLASGSAAALAGGAAFAGVAKRWGANLDATDTVHPIRPPGSVPEEDFLQMCIRCGECFKACPNNVLQVQGFAQGLEGLWTPIVNADWAGCESSCNACGQVCPTGAIRALPIEEKRHARMGLAIVNQETCLPIAGLEACDLCVQECIAAGYDAIAYEQVGTEVDEQGLPIEGSGFLAPVVLDDKCVGCGLCQTRCYSINVKERHVLDGSAIVVEAGEGREDRQLLGSYQKNSPFPGASNGGGKDTGPSSGLGPAQPTHRQGPPAVEQDSAVPPAKAKDFGDNPFGM